MEIKIKKTININTIDEWKNYSGPMSLDQWKDGRSAKLLAEYTLSNEFASNLTRILDKIEFPISKKFLGEPEVITKLPHGSNGRHHDLLLKSENEKSIIAIEAKVGETFGNIISDEYNGRNGKSVSRDKVNRIKELCEILGSNPDIMSNYRYQLLTGVAGTILEGKKILKKNPKIKTLNSLFLIITFTGNVELRPGESPKDNYNDYKKFRDEVLETNKDGLVRKFFLEEDPKRWVNLFIKYQEIDVPMRFKLK